MSVNFKAVILIMHGEMALGVFPFLCYRVTAFINSKINFAV